MSKNTKQTVLTVVWLGVLIGLIFAIRHFGTNPPPPPPPPPPPKLDEAALAKEWPQIMAHACKTPRGKTDTPYTMIEFGDFECNQCAAVRPIIEQVIEIYPKNVNLYFIQRPFTFHKYAIPAGMAAAYANDKGKFWQMYDILFANQENLEPGYYRDYAKKIGLDGDDLQKKVEGNAYIAQVTESQKFCDSIGVKMTPTILIHDNKTGKVVYGAGKEQIAKLFANLPWNAQAQNTAAGSGVTPKGQ